MAMSLSASAQAEPAKEFDPEAYATVLAQARTGDPATNYHALRMQTLYHADYMMGHWDQQKEAFKDIDTDPAQALRLAEAEMDIDYTEMFAHVVAEHALGKLGRGEEAQTQHNCVVGLLRSITGGKHGLSADDAFTVISVPEEYETLILLGMAPSGKQALQNAGGHSYDTLDATEHASGERVTIYFNIDAYFGKELGTHFGK